MPSENDGEPARMTDHDILTATANATRLQQIQGRVRKVLFEDKVVIVTGGAGGIGRATAEAFAKEGAHAVIADLNNDGAKAAAKAISDAGGPEALASPVRRVG